MKTMISISRAQAQLPRLVRADTITGIMQDEELAAFIVPRQRMESLLDTIDFLSNPQAGKAIAKFQSGKMKFRSLRSVKSEFKEKA